MSTLDSLMYGVGSMFRIVTIEANAIRAAAERSMIFSEYSTST
jgi:hypothetical protein